MDYTTLGRTELKVSVAGLGCGGFSRLGLNTGGTGASAIAIIHSALDHGGNPGDDTKGSFSASFVSDGSYAAGRAVSGTFHAVAIDAGFGDWTP